MLLNLNDNTYMMNTIESLCSSSPAGGNCNDTKNTFMFSKFAFPFKLHRLLEDAEKNGRWSPIVSWTPSGKAFKIHKPKEFAALVMPRYFDQTKYRSFQRQLYIYGFVRKDKSSSSPKDELGAYAHELFVRGSAELCLNMSRKKVKGTGRSRTKKAAAAAGGGGSNIGSSHAVLSSLAANANAFGARESFPAADAGGTRRCSLRLRQQSMQAGSFPAGGTTKGECSMRRHQSAPPGPTRKLSVASVGGSKRCSLGFVRTGPSSGTRAWERRKSSVLVEGEEVFFWNEMFHFVTEGQESNGGEF